MVKQEQAAEGLPSSPSRAAAQTPGIHPATRLGRVHLTVGELSREIAFYREVLGFRLHWQEAGQASLGNGDEELLRLSESPGAQRAHRSAGLYHFALLVPSRWELAQLLARIAQSRTRIQGMVNHHTHLAIYLPDPEGNGIELAWDFPRERWPDWGRDGSGLLRLGNAPLEPEELFVELERDRSPWAGLTSGTRIGHVHLHVADLGKAEAFYHGLLGFDVIFNSGEMGALFLSAGGYHHHIGANIWRGAGAPPAPEGAAGLRSFTVALPDEAALARVAHGLEGTVPADGGLVVHDPSGIAIRLAVAARTEP